MRQGDDGATTTEYVGVLAVVALVIGSVSVAFVATPLGPSTARLVCEVLQQECGGAGEGVAAPTVVGQDVRTDADYAPPPCMLSEDGEVAAAQVTIGFVTFGDDYGFVEREYADGRVTLTAVDGATIGLLKSGDLQVLQIGSLDDETQLGGSLSVSGGLDLSYGDTWSFESRAHADAMREQLDDYLLQQVQIRNAGQGAPGLHLWLWLSDGYLAPPADPSVTFATIGLDAALSGSFGLQEPLGPGPDGEPRYLDPNVGVEAALSGDADVKVETDHDTGEQSWTYALSGTGSAGGNLVVGEAAARGTTTGAFRITRDADGEITRIAMISTREGGAEAGLEGRSPVSVPVGPSASGSARESTATVTEVALDVRTAEQRQVVQDWLSSNNEQLGTPLALTTSALVPDRASPDDPFADLLYREATVSQVTYDDVRDTQSFGLDVKAGWELGLSVTMDQWRRDAAAARFLGAPRPDGTRELVTDEGCS